MHRAACLRETTCDMCLHAGVILQFSIAGKFLESVFSRPVFDAPKKLPANAAPSQIFIHIPAFQIRCGNSRSSLHMIVSDGHFGKAAKFQCAGAVIAADHEHNAAIFGAGELLHLQEVSLLRAIRPQRVAHPQPFTTVAGLYWSHVEAHKT